MIAKRSIHKNTGRLAIGKQRKNKIFTVSLLITLKKNIVKHINNDKYFNNNILII